MDGSTVLNRWLARVVIVSVAASPLIFLLLQSAFADRPFALDLMIASSRGGMLQVFYDRGSGFNEAESQAVPIPGGAALRAVRVSLPQGNYRALRIDPPAAGGAVTIAQARLLGIDDRPILDISIADLNPALHLAVVHAGPPLVLSIPAGSTDRQLIWTPSESVVLQAPRSGRRLAATALALWTLVLVLLLLAERLLTPASIHARRLLTRAATTAAARPATAVMLAALCGTAVAMHPLLFGRSLVSPANGGAWMLYNAAPFTPGSQDRLVKDNRGTDVGAAMWAFVPYSHVQRLALAQGEWPLWNRYNAAGRPLWGQGQSQILDPLHWLTLLFADPAPGWDAKFVAHRVVFAAGIGICVLLVTGHWASAALLAFVAPFISYYAVRLNHPAQYTLTYAPWTLAAWVLLASSSSFRRFCQAIGGVAVGVSLIVVASPPKEAVVMTFAICSSGMLMLLLAPSTFADLGRRLAGAAAAGMIATLLTAPHWLVFVTTLTASVTNYDVPAAHFASWPFALPLMFGVMAPGSLLPGTHVVAAACAISSMCAPAVWKVPVPLAVILGAIGSAAIAFGAIPESLIVAIPLIANVHQIHFSFLTATAVLMLVAAGIGVSQLAVGPGPSVWASSVAVMAAGVLVLTLAFDGGAASSSLAGMWMIAAVTLGACLPPLIAGAHRPGPQFLQVCAVSAAVIWLVLPNGLHLASLSDADPLVIQPGVRADLDVNSPALTLRSDQQNIGRVLGIDQLLFPGTYALYEVEGIGGPDALQLPRYEDLIDAYGTERYWGWNTLVRHSQIAALNPLLDLLGVQHLVVHEGERVDGTIPMTDDDDQRIDVLERPTAWPRAFFTDAVLQYDTLSGLVQQSREAVQPFAAIQRTDADARALIGDLPARAGVMVPADVRLTANTTTVNVTSAAAGVLVLVETWMPRDFVVSINGQSAPYVRVNHAFKGVRIPSAGVWTIHFRYEPEWWVLSWALSLLGAVGLGSVFLASGSRVEAALLRRRTRAFEPQTGDCQRE